MYLVLQVFEVYVHLCSVMPFLFLLNIMSLRGSHADTPSCSSWVFTAMWYSFVRTCHIHTSSLLLLGVWGVPSWGPLWGDYTAWKMLCSSPGAYVGILGGPSPGMELLVQTKFHVWHYSTMPNCFPQWLYSLKTPLLLTIVNKSSPYFSFFQYLVQTSFLNIVLGEFLKSLSTTIIITFLT